MGSLWLCMLGQNDTRPVLRAWAAGRVGKEDARFPGDAPPLALTSQSGYTHQRRQSFSRPVLWAQRKICKWCHQQHSPLCSSLDCLLSLFHLNRQFSFENSFLNSYVLHLLRTCMCVCTRIRAYTPPLRLHYGGAEVRGQPVGLVFFPSISVSSEDVSSLYLLSHLAGQRFKRRNTSV